jgi:Domain of unknown function (DUF5664)
MTNYEIKDSGERKEYASGMVRDTQDGKAMFTYLFADGIPYDEQFITRCALHMTKGFIKYGHRNWERANSAEEVERFRASAMRHLIMWACGMRDEDHAAAVVFNLIAAESTQLKIGKAEHPMLHTLFLPDSGQGFAGTASIESAPESRQDDPYRAGTAIRRVGSPQFATNAYVTDEPDENGIGHARWEGLDGGRFRFDVAEWVPVA